MEYKDTSSISNMRNSSPTSRRRKRVAQLKRIPLWYFLHELLQMDTTAQLVEWTDKTRYEFTIKNPQEVAYMWGNLKDKSNMTYPKLARGIRYYYGKRVIEKVPNSRFCYQFIYSDKTKPIFEGKQIDENDFNDSQSPQFSNINNDHDSVELMKTNTALSPETANGISDISLERDRSHSGSSNSSASPASSTSDDFEDQWFFNMQSHSRNPGYYSRLLEELSSSLSESPNNFKDCSLSPQSYDGAM